MRRISMTCKHHPELRWSAKSIAVNNDGSYNGCRSIMFGGIIEDKTSPFHSDMSGVACTRVGSPPECRCSPKDLIFSPEDKKLKEHYESKSLV
jgi:hypothetical protein